MKKLILIMTSLFIAQGALAGPTTIGTKDNIPVTVMNAQGALSCYTTHDTKKDVVRLEAPVTFLAAKVYRQEYEGANGSVCSLVDKIIEKSFMNFTAFKVAVDSELLLGRSQIIENTTLKISNLGVMESSPELPIVEMQIQLSQKLKQTKPDFLGN